MKINNLDKYLEPLRYVLKKEGKREKEIEEEIRKIKEQIKKL